MSGLVLIVDFRLIPGTRAEFRRLIDANARLSAQTEQGCRRFDVVEPHGEADRVLLYEIYEDETAFEAHGNSPHYKQFEAQSAALVDTKTVIKCNLVCDGRKSETG